MALVNPMSFLNKAKKEGKAVGAFNVLSLEMVQGVIAAAENKNTPVILQVSTGAMKWAKFEYMVPMILSAAKTSKVDIAVHLDHSQDLELIRKCVDAGFPSVMYDGSHFDIDKNIKESNEMIKFCKNKAAIEIEIGKVGGKEDDLEAKEGDEIQIDDVVKFYEKTKPDILAVAFGTAHGRYKTEINLDYKLIEKCAKVIPVPLVMHGTSGVPFNMIKKSIKAGITKVNVGTDLLIANYKAIRQFLIDNPKAYDIRKINTLGIQAITNRVEEYLDLFANK